ncbi:hypothetical protein BWI93_14710 [Siphonobacter sp. BAB-5385]|uniref:hypothetical protein n=1 Tax=Siphonobacter sp. BAB-5385 TaxID=1864822 RepID=UPI000B9E3244|nr:hypothetical protein [Siphonobacter sp. BAB-5385]OZI07289.1 hypothetical protein BWI93_14710 [Siphonobacter sp. BAB-5385]
MNFLHQLGSVISLFSFILVQSLLFVRSINAFTSRDKPSTMALVTVFACFLVTIGLYYYTNAEHIPFIRILLMVNVVQLILLAVLFLLRTKAH